ncbi:MAG TPA: hypothetical protein VIG92_02765 [Rhodospirillales bacterium]
MRGLTLAVAAAGLVGVLTACSAYEYATDLISTPIVLQCPKSWVIADAANLVRFRQGGGRDLTDVDYEGQITGVRLGCTTNLDKKTRVGTMDVDVNVLFDATRGPANRDRKALFRYFISVSDNDRKILYREAFSLPVEFPGNTTRLRIQSSTITLQLPIDPKRSSSYYLVFAGYELTHEELEFNRTRQAKTVK